MSGKRIFEPTDRRARYSRTAAFGPVSAHSLLVCLWCITQAAASGTAALAQQVTPKAPRTAAPSASIGTSGTPLDQSHPEPPASGSAALPDAPGSDQFPAAVPVPEAGATTVVIESDRQSRSGHRLLLEGAVVVTYGGYQVRADHITYDEDTGEVEANGHVQVTGSSHSERLSASHATLNIRTETGRFYDVNGSIGVRNRPHGNVYTTGNPFLFTGRIVVRNGPEDFDIYDGTVTSCQLPTPDWLLSAARFTVHDGEARAKNTIFRLRRLPIFFLPYVTHPTRAGERQSGILIPIFGNSSSKGIVLGEQIYMVLNRSSDLTVGAQYFSMRGWQQSATFRLRGNGLDFANAHYSGLLDRGLQQVVNGQKVVTDQGGEDILFNGRKDFGEHTRAAASVEYLSSYIYREAFTENFNQAVSSDITSYAYGTHADGAYVASVEADRYQGLKVVSTGQQIRIFHAPLVQAEALEQRIRNSPLLWSATAQYAELKRTQGTAVELTGFASNFTGRLDLHPQLAAPFAFAGFHFRPEVGLRETYYTHARRNTPLPGPPPVEVNAGLSRTVTEAGMEVRLPVLERTFDTGPFSRFLGREARHTIEPELHYRYASGVSDFNRTLRFDDLDVVSNKNELEYGFVQRLFLRPAKQRACGVGETPTVVSTEDANANADAGDAADSEAPAVCGGTRETLRWRLLQRHYFDDTFGGIIVNNRRNVLDTTLDLSGVAFLTDRRSVSPIVSEMKLSATDHIDLEWDINYDTHAGKFTQSNTFLDYHQGTWFAGLSHARLNAPGRFNTINDAGVTTSSLISDFSQLRVLVGYGTPTKPGLSIAANAGVDLKLSQMQYAAAQFSYNWNCCGFSAEYRKYELGSVRNENAYRFNFTLANIGTAGNLRRAERLF